MYEYVEKSQLKGIDKGEEMERCRTPLAEGPGLVSKTRGDPVSSCYETLETLVK